MEEENTEKKEKKDNLEREFIKEVGERTAIIVLATLLSGLSIGFMMGVMFAPKKGKQTRKEIIDKSKEFYQKSEKAFKDAFNKTKDITEDSKDKFIRIKDIISPKNKEQEKENKEEKPL